MLKDGLIAFLLLGSTFFFLTGTVGLLRLPDVFTRMHATTKCDTMGAGLALLALMIFHGLTLVSLKLLILLIFIWLTGPASAYITAKAACVLREKGRTD